MLITFEVGTSNFAARSNKAACGAGALAIGSVSQGDGGDDILCDDAQVRIQATPGSGTTVVSLRGDIEIGQEVRAGAGAQPLLLNATAKLFVRHGAPVDLLCGVRHLESLCDRFVVGQEDLAVGDSVHLHGESKDAPAAGFLRLDPDEQASGMMFEVSAPNAGFEVRRLEGETYHLSDSLFDRIQKSRVLQALNATLLALATVFWFVKALDKAREGADISIQGCIILSVGVLAAAISPARADQAFIRAGEIGQAVLRSRADRCYGVTLQHVMAGEAVASVVAPGRHVGDATLLRLVPATPENLALVIVTGLSRDDCPAFEGALALDTILRASISASLRLVSKDGSFERLPLTIQSVDVETFTVVPTQAATGFGQGMSGGTVFIGPQPVGILADVQEGRVGRIVRLDRAFERLAPYFGGETASRAASSAAPSGTIVSDINLTPVRWSEEPVSQANRAAALFEPGGTWRVAAERAELVAQVAPGKTIGAVVVDGAIQPDPARTVEVFFGPSETGPWRSVATLAMEPNDGVRKVSLAPTRTGYVLLRLSGRQPGQPVLSLSGFSLRSR